MTNRIGSTPVAPVTGADPGKPFASLSLDLDNEWSYLKAHANPVWKDYPSYLNTAIPRILALLKECRLRITFFIVGTDASFDRHREALASIVDAGHEVGNHTFRHDPWLHRYSEDEFDTELQRAEEAIQNSTGVRPRGFRGPGYSMYNHALKVLSRRGYLFDSSTMPTYIGPLARAYFFLKSSFDQQQKEERKILFGSFRDGLRPLRPYYWRTEGSTFLELPLTTVPLVRLPFHVSYVLYLSTFSASVALHYWKSSLRMCRTCGIEPNLLLHPLDFLGRDDVKSLAFFPAMELSSEEKLDRVRSYLMALKETHSVLPMNEYAEIVKRRPHLDVRPPDFHVGSQ